MKLVILESPYAGAVKDNIRYARRCTHDSVHRNEAPLVSHLLYTQPHILDDSNPSERALGIAAGHAWYLVADLCVVYIDCGISVGMILGIHRALQWNIPVEYRKLLA